MGEQAIFENNLKRWKNEAKPIADTSFKSLRSIENLPINTKIPSLTSILKDTESGKQILKFYEENKVLHEQHRVLLINILAKYLDLKGYNCTITDCSNIEFQICSLFATYWYVNCFYFYTFSNFKNIFLALLYYSQAGKGVQ